MCWCSLPESVNGKRFHLSLNQGSIRKRAEQDWIVFGPWKWTNSLNQIVHTGTGANGPVYARKKGKGDGEGGTHGGINKVGEGQLLGPAEGRRLSPRAGGGYYDWGQTAGGGWRTGSNGQAEAGRDTQSKVGDGKRSGRKDSRGDNGALGAGATD